MPLLDHQSALRHLKASSVIINTSSVQAVKPSPVLLDYAQTKACLAVFTKSLAKQLGPKGIRVNAVALVLTGRCCNPAAGSRWKK
jgi:NAD(P)-dependent dehydrogenase (short-subunit alcohol dehydrogenase family)